jgi:hypothetical protein
MITKTSCFRLLLFFLLSSLVYSCEKEGHDRKDLITIGNYEGLKVVFHDTVLVGGYHNLQQYFLDVDGDGNNDFVLTSNIWGSPGMGQHPEADIASLDKQFFFNMIDFRDTSFLHTQIDTFYGNQVEIYIRKYNTCNRMGLNDSILSSRDNHFIRVLERNQTISANDHWLSDTLDLNHHWISWYNILSSTPDTIVIEDNVYLNECHSFPNDKIAWIGISKQEAAGMRLGWIKMAISENYKITILETAIQE